MEGPITHVSSDIPAALQNAKDSNENCKTIVYDVSSDTYDVYSDNYITMFNNNEIIVDASTNIDSYEYICTN